MERNVTGRQVLSGVLLGLAAVAMASNRESDVYLGRVETTKERKVREYRAQINGLAARIPNNGDYFTISEARRLVDRALTCMADYCGYSDFNHTCGESEVRVAIDNLERFINRSFRYEPATIVYEAIDPKTRAIQEMRAELRNYQERALAISDSFHRRSIANLIDDAERAIGRFEQYGRHGDYMETSARRSVQAVGTEFLRSR